MKINKLMFALLAGTMMASCSDRNDEPVGPDPDAVGSTGYIGISIGMPAQVVARGANDQFDDGLAAEYNVYDAVLIFFTGTEDNAKFYKAYGIGANEWNPVNDNPNQITQNQIVTFPVDFAKESEEDLWVLAVLNPNGVVNVGRGYTLTVGNEPFTGTFKDFLAKTTTAPLSSTQNGFFMTNAPHSSVPGTITDLTKAPTNGKFRVLAAVNKDRICATAQAASELPAAAIFVERALAKVEVDASRIGIKDGAINFPSTGEFKVYDTDWALDNMEPESFLVRNLDFNYDGTNTPYWAYYDTNSKQSTLYYHYRFLGNAGFGHTFWPNTPDVEEHYRTYFCIDPHGNGINEGDAPLVSAKATDFSNTGSSYPKYCKENTFDVKHMDYRNTTRAIIKVQFSNTGNLYTVGEDHKNAYFFEDAASYLTFAILNDPNVIEAWTAHFDGLDKTYANEATTQGMTYNRANRTATNEWMNVTMVANETTGRLVVQDITLKDGENNNIVFDAEKAKETIATVNENVIVKFYKDGVAYYAVRIRHFGNDLAPWTAPDATTNTTEESYGRTEGAIGPQDIQNYLGRYGVVRNNWYVLNLGDINQMGEPVVGDLPLDGTPDDRVLKEESISCRINILSWAKRNQTDEL